MLEATLSGETSGTLPKLPKLGSGMAKPAEGNPPECLPERAFSITMNRTKGALVRKEPKWSLVRVARLFGSETVLFEENLGKRGNNPPPAAKGNPFPPIQPSARQGRSFAESVRQLEPRVPASGWPGQAKVGRFFLFFC